LNLKNRKQTLILVNLLLKFWRSSIGKKWIVAVTGLALLGFVAAHLAGNLQMFAGPQKLNAYAEFLHANQNLLWVARIGLIAAFLTHIFATVSLVIANRAARPEKYAVGNKVPAKLSTRLMALSGLTVLSFVIFHLLHYTFRMTDPRFKTLAEGDVYQMVILGFQSPLVSGFYLLSLALLSLHLKHGVSSVFQTLGIETRNNRGSIAGLAALVSAAVFIGYASIPAGVLLGILK
jgi:succinate dehydrogenase / fumarate reductase cytochrome b subunit